MAEDKVLKQREQELIVEIRSLNNKVLALKEEIKIRERHLQSVNEGITEQANTIKSISIRLKEKHAEQRSLDHILNSLKTAIASGEKDLKKQGNEHRTQLAHLEEEKKFIADKMRGLEQTNLDIKNQIIVLEKKKSEINDLSKKQSDQAMKNKQEKLREEDRMKIVQQERNTFDKAKASIDQERDELMKEKELCVKAIGESNCLIDKYNGYVTRVTEKQGELDSKLIELNDLRKKHELLKEEFESKLNSIVQEKKAINEDKKKLQIAELKFKKLVKEKELDKELRDLMN